ncbi:MAG: hypothetical protein SVV80_13825, partial [Planctomycetota bacterium]|nr:hypothetical protein [Planctomycetota bacterium]
ESIEFVESCCSFIHLLLIKNNILKPFDGKQKVLGKIERKIQGKEKCEGKQSHDERYRRISHPINRGRSPRQKTDYE